MFIRFLLIFFLFFYFNPIAFSQNDNLVPPVVISATPKINDKLMRAPQKRIITQQEITNKGMTSLAQTLQELGGVQLQDTTGNGSQLFLGMRGFGVNASSNTLLLINGIPITNPDLAPPNLNVIPLQEIEYIEVTSGTESVLYGDQAVGGAINIVTRQNKEKRFDVACSAGSYNQRNCYAALQKKFKKLETSISGSATHTNNYRVHNDYDQQLLSGQFYYPYNTGDILLNYQMANERMQYPGALTAQQVKQNRRQSSNHKDFFGDWNGFYYLKNQQQLTNTWRMETDFARREMHGSGTLTLPFDQLRTIHFAKTQLKGNILRNASLVTGLDFENDQYHLSSLLGPTNDKQQKYSLFSMTQIELNPKISFNLGARGAQQNNILKNPAITYSINRALATTIGATYLFSHQIKLYLRRAESFRFPKADEDASTPQGVNGLKTQRGVSYESGALFDWKQLTGKLSLYQLNLRDEIMFDPFQTPRQPFGANTNLSPTQRRGFSLSEKYWITEKLSFDSQYNYVNARFQSGINAGCRIPLVSEHLLLAGINYFFKENWSGYLEAIYTGNQFAANDNANIARKIGGYTVINSNLRYQFKNISATFRINNIFNKQYYFYSVYQTGIKTEYYYPAPERNFIFSLKYSIS